MTKFYAKPRVWYPDNNKLMSMAFDHRCPRVFIGRIDNDGDFFFCRAEEVDIASWAELRATLEAEKWFVEDDEGRVVSLNYIERLMQPADPTDR